MYKIKVNAFEKVYLMEEMIKIFLPPEEYTIVEDNEDIRFNRQGSQDKNEIKREIYEKLSTVTGQHPPWGILTGIRPVKLWGELLEKSDNLEEAYSFMKEEYLISQEKLEKIKAIYEYQVRSIGFTKKGDWSFYVGVPFCPTRCLYCSFLSNQSDEINMGKYVNKLMEEIKYIGLKYRELEIPVESIYVGGGTPTTLPEKDLERLLLCINEYIPQKIETEFTVEAGRPDTITEGKLSILEKYKVNRISINPQTMNDRTLKLIGREHTCKDIIDAFNLARKFNFTSINMDLIAGLPGETLKDFNETVSQILDLNPENITIHSLAVKRASRLKDIDKDFHYKRGGVVSEMLELGDRLLLKKDYIPYYLYRQKHMSGALENVGYCKKNTESIYNMRIMDEHEDIVSAGAGGISKAYYPEENRLERVPNVSNFNEYIDRLDEMIKRKENNLFSRR